MESENQQFMQERAERLRLLSERQERELDAFDQESACLGFRYIRLNINASLPLFKMLIQRIHYSALAIAENSKEVYPDEEQSLSGSMLSLAHSNSSASFPAGSL